MTTGLHAQPFSFSPINPILLRRLVNPTPQCFSTWVATPYRGREPLLEGSRADILCPELDYICFIRVLAGVVGLYWVAMMGGC